MSKKFSELPPKESLDSADYIPIVDSADSNPETQNKIVTFQTVRGYFTEDLDEFLEQAQTAESARVAAENTRRSNETTRQNNETTRQSNETTREANEATRQTNETARENAETGYIQQAKSWAVGTNGVAREGDATDNAKYYAEQASASATSAGTSATNASASETSAATSAQSAQASAIEAAQSAQSVDAPELTRKILSAFPTGSASGEIIVFEDGADDIPVKEMTIDIPLHQEGSGDPSPSNVRPISAYTEVNVTRAGKNLLENKLTSGTYSGVVYTKNADGSITANGTCESQSAVKEINSPLVLKKGTYILSGGSEDTRIRLNRYDKNGTLIDRLSSSGEDVVFVIDDNVDYSYVGVYSYPTGVVVDNVTVYPMIRSATIKDNAYEQYQEQVYTVTIPTGAEAIHSGKLTVAEDGSGTLTVDTGYLAVTDSSSFAEIGSFTEGTNGNRCGFRVRNNPFTLGAELYCNIAKTDASVNNGNGDNWIADTCYTYSSGGGASYFRYIFPKTITSGAEGLQYLIDNGCEIVYALNTPQTYSLTIEQVTTLLGVNSFWVDANGIIDLEYHSNPQTIQKEIKNTRNDALASYAVETASDTVVAFNDGADNIPVKGIVLNIEPHQDGSGDPSPDNVRAISGYSAVEVTRAGKNLMNIPETTLVMGVNRTLSVDLDRILPIYTYTLSVTVTANTATKTFNAAARNYSTTIAGVTFAAGETGKKSVTFTSNMPITRLYAYLSSSETDGASVTFTDVQLEAGEVATDYTPYVNPVVRYITFPAEAGTLYGGKLTVYQDGSGTLTVDRLKINASSLTWSQSTQVACRFVAYVNPRSAGKGSPVVCSVLPSLDAYPASTATGIFMNTATQIIANVPDITTQEDWDAMITAKQPEIVYQIENATTYALTAEEVTTLLGSNTVFMSADGTIDLAYRADTTLYINNLITGIHNNIAYIEDGQTASRAYSVGQYVLIGGQLYKVTSAIASGATFTIGTNVTATTVGTELTALN